MAVTKAQRAGAYVLEVDGVIDADLDAEALTAGLQGEVVVIDLQRALKITSFGVRRWIDALKEQGAKYLCFLNVQPAIMSQFNMIKDFSSGGDVLSLHLPYVCDWCDEETTRLLDLRRDFDGVVENGHLPEVTCGNCGGAASFDDLPASYLSFAAKQGAPHPPAAARAALDDGPADEPLRVRQEVTDKLTMLWLNGHLDGRTRLKRIISGLEGDVVCVCENVSGVDEAGSERFGQLLGGTDYRLTLSRVPLQLLLRLRPEEQQGMFGRLLSWMLPVRCSKCRTITTVEIDAADEADAQRKGWQLSCAACGEPAKPARNDVPSRERLWSSDVSEHVRSYAKGHPKPTEQKTAMRKRGVFGRWTDDHQASGATNSGKYEILQPIGVGGMAEVFIARQTGIAGFEKVVVLKRIKQELERYPVFIKMFLEEGRLAASVSHPNVVQIFELGKEDGHYFLAMELVRGWDLRSLLRVMRNRRILMPVELVARVMADVCAGLTAAHTATDPAGMPLGIVHRDVSPHNILLSIDGGVKLTDFGIAKARDSSLQTRSGQLKGKVVYMAPEQISPELGPVDSMSDVWSLGLVAFELLALRSPFRVQSEAEFLTAVVHASIPDVRTRRPDAPSDIAQAISWALQRDRGKRCPSARELGRAFEDVAFATKRMATSTHLADWLDRMTRDPIASGELPPLPMGTMDQTATLRAGVRTIEDGAGGDTELIDDAEQAKTSGEQ